MKILMATGGSPFSQSAMKIGARLAKAENAQVTVLTVDDPKESIDVEKAQGEARELLKSEGIEDPEMVVRKGRAEKEILEEAKRCDVLVMGTLGAGQWGIIIKLMGDTAIQVLENTNVSALVIRGDKEVKKILVAVSAPKFNPKVINYGRKLASALGASMRILNVKSVPDLYSFGTSHERTSHELFEIYPNRKESLEIAAGIVRNAGVPVDIKMREGLVEEEIIRESREGDFDLIVVGHYGWRGFKALLLGSLPLTLARDSDRSVFVVMPKKKV